MKLMFSIFKVPEIKHLDYHERARFLLTWRVIVTILLTLIVFSFFTFIIAPNFFTVVGVSLILTAIIFLILRLTLNYGFPAKLFLIFGVITSSIQLLFVNDIVHVVDIVWFLAIVMFGYFVLGKYWGTVGLITFISTLSIYIYFRMYINLQSIGDLTFELKIFMITNTILAGLVFSFIVNHFIKTTRFAELQLNEKNIDLTTKNIIIENQNRLNTIMLKEIHHRVKNNLQIISSLLRLQSAEVNNPELEKHFEDSINRIKTMALIHEKLYKNDLSNINIYNYFKDLSDDFLGTYNKDKAIELYLKIEIENVNIKTLVPLALLFNELFSNSLKHAYKNVQNGKITVSLKQINDTIIFEYRDDGIWEELTKRSSFGMEMIETFTEQLDGHFTREINNGTFYKFDLNVIKESEFE